ncbi:hypothetical protein [Francisella sp. 19X1-34]|uniref:hypothetical protein n=1 Tax=Francisella sp. 19X1-34 TaxID=3087177 RepID=UPI002E330016|nr:hypothetical protein [Francisella sp. 19X1-34]MED7788463.1 hypothetical protein [Francisella sp. 19X1-34]
MIKKLTNCIFVLLILFNYGLSNDNTVESSINSQTTSKSIKPSNNSTFNNLIVKPVRNIGIGVVSIAMAPIGAFVGVFEGVSKTKAILYNGEHHSGDSDIVNIIVAPLAAAGLAVGGAGYMAYKLPQETAKSLSKKESN